MTMEILDGNEAAAYAVRLARVKSIPCFPITPTTSLIEMLAKWKADGKLNAEFNQLESEHSVMSAAFGSELAGARTFTSTSSQGLLLMHEILCNVSGARLPVVMVNVSRGISSPLTLWCDHCDVLSMRDAGWIIFMAETNQEVLDSVIMAYKIAEDENVLLPVIVNMDGFIQSYTRTEVEIPNQKKVDRFLPGLNLKFKIDFRKPRTYYAPAMEDYMFYKSQMHKAQLESMKTIRKVHIAWKKLTKRNYGFVEKYKLSGAKAALVMMGANSSIGKAAVDEMRKKGKKVGLLRVRLYRPFPTKEIFRELKEIKNIAVMDQNIAPGAGGILYPEIKSLVKKSRVSSYVFGLGGKSISQKEIINILNEILKGRREEKKWLV